LNDGFYSQRFPEFKKQLLKSRQFVGFETWRRVAAGRMVGVGEFEQFNGRAIFDYESDADAVGWAVGRNQDFAPSKLGGEISHFKRDVRNLPDEIRGPPRPLRNASTPRQIRFSRG
jgi:hypothetical protein